MKRKYRNKEKGDIAIIAAFSSLLFVALVALVIDFGLIYYQSARMQNAVDSAVIAVTHEFNSETNSQISTAEQYLKLNGFDVTKKGARTQTFDDTNNRLTINYGSSGDAIITIDWKGSVAENGDAYIDDDDELYIDGGYVKMTVSMKGSGIFSAMSGTNSMRIKGTGYAKCEMNEVSMPEALNYTLFATSTEKQTDYKNMALQINGRANNTQAITNIFAELINGFTNSIIKPVIGGIFGDSAVSNIAPVTPSTSYTILNGDVYSSSDISVATNTLQASRVKDPYYDGSNDSCNCQTLCTSSKRNENCSVCQADEGYLKCVGDEQHSSTYNQTIFKARNSINFTAEKAVNDSFLGGITDSIKSGLNDKYTKVIFQNYQYLEQTQVVLDIIDRLDFKTISSTETLREAFTTMANSYIGKNVTLTETQAAAVKNQVNNLEYDVATKTITLNNQQSIIYTVTNNTANGVMTEIRDATTNGTKLLNDIKSIDSTATENNGPVTYEVSQDIVIEYTKAGDSTNSVTLIIKSPSTTNKNLPMYGDNKLTIDSNTIASYRFSLAKTFQQNCDLIAAPNMKPYFVRAINRSVRNSTTSKNSDETAGAATDNATSVKSAVTKVQTKLTSLINSKNNLATIDNGNGYFTKGAADASTTVSDTADGVANTYIDNTFKTDESLVNVATTPLFRRLLGSSGGSYTLANYGNTDTGHTTYKDEELFDTSGELKTADDFVEEFNDANESNYGADAVNTFKAQSVEVDSDHADSTVHDYDSHYAKEAVDKKKDYIEKTYLSFNESFETVAPSKDSVFLMSSGTKKNYMESAIKSVVDSIAATPAVDTNTPTDYASVETAQEATAPDTISHDIAFTIAGVNVPTISAVIETISAKVVSILDKITLDLSGEHPETVVSSTTFNNTIERKYSVPNPTDSTADATNINVAYRYDQLFPTTGGTTIPSVLSDTRSDFNKDLDIKSTIDNYYASRPGRPTTSNTKGKVSGRVSTSDCPNDRYWLKDNTYYEGVEGVDIYNGWWYNMGLLVKSGSTVICKYINFNNSSAQADVLIGDNSSTNSTFLYVDNDFVVKSSYLTIGDNTTVVVNGNLSVENSGHGITIGKNSTVIVAGSISASDKISIGEGSKVYAGLGLSYNEFDSADTSEVYVTGGDLWCFKSSSNETSEIVKLGGKIYCTGRLTFEYTGKKAGRTIVKENAQVYLGGYIDNCNNGDVKIYDGATVVVNGAKEVDGKKYAVYLQSTYWLYVYGGANLVTKTDNDSSYDSYIFASGIEQGAGSLIVADVIESNYNGTNPLNVANIICKDLNVNKVKLYDGTYIFAAGGMSANTVQLCGKSTSADSKTSVKFAVNNNITGTISNMPDKYVFFCGGTISGLGGDALTIGDGCAIAVKGNITVGDLTLNEHGEMYIPAGGSVTATNVTFNKNSAAYIHTLNATGNVKIYQDTKLNTITGSSNIIVYSGARLLVEGNCTCASLENQSSTYITNKLTCSSTGDCIKNTGVMIVGLTSSTNPGNSGEIDCSGEIINENIIQVEKIGSSNVANVKSGSINNKLDASKFCISGNASTAAIVNKGVLQLDGNLTSTNIVLNDNILLVLSGGSSMTGSLNNSGKAHFNGNSRVENVTNSGEFRVLGKYTGSVTANSGTLYCTLDADIGIADNTGTINIGNNLDAAGKSVSNGTGTLEVVGYAKTANFGNKGLTTVNGYVDASGDVENTATFNVGGSLKATGKIDNSGTFTVVNGASADGDFTNKNTFITVAALTVGGDFKNSKNVSVTGNVTVDGAFDNSDTTNVPNFTIDGNLTVGKEGTTKNLTSNGVVLVKGSISATGDIETKDAMSAVNSITAGGSFTNDTNKTVITNGSLTAGGLLTNKGRMEISGELKADGGITNTSELYVIQKIMSGAVSNSGVIRVQNNTFTITGGLTNTNEITAQSDVSATGAATNSGTINTNGTFTSGNLTNSSMMSIKGNITANGYLTNNASSSIYTNGYIHASGDFTNNGTIGATGEITSAGFTNGGTVNTCSYITTTSYFTNTAVLNANGVLTVGGNFNNEGTLNACSDVSITGSMSNGNTFITNGDLSVGTNLSNTSTTAGDYKLSVKKSITVGGKITNEKTIVANNQIQAGNGISNTGLIDGKANISVTAGDVDNSGRIYANSSLIVTADINNSASSKIYVDGSSNNNVLGAKNVVNAGAIVVDKGNMVTESVTQQANGGIAIKNGDFTTTNFIITGACLIDISGSTTIHNTFTNKTNLKLVGFSAKKIINEGNLYVDPSSELKLDYLWNKEGANFACTKDITVENQTDSVSILNGGGMYVEGDITCYGTFCATGGEAYIYGDLDAGNTVTNNSSTIILENNAQLYTYGTISSNDSNQDFWIKEKTTTVDGNALLSVYGKGTGTITLGEYNVEQAGARVYFGTDVVITPNDYSLATTKSINNNGTEYFYGDLSSTKKFTFKQNGGFVAVKGNVGFDNVILDIKSKSTFESFGKKAKFYDIDVDNSNLYLCGIEKETEDGKYNPLTSSLVIDLKDHSTFYYPEGITISATITATGSSSHGSGGNITVNVDDLFGTGTTGYTTKSNIEVTKNITIPEGVTLCVQGNINIVTAGLKDGKITNNGNLYVLGTITVDGKPIATDTLDGYDKDKAINLDDYIVISGNNSDTFIGRQIVGDNKNSYVTLKGYLKTVGNQKVYIDNDLIINGCTSAGDAYVPNRGESIVLDSSSNGSSRICISGDVFSSGVNNTHGNAIYVGENCDFSCGGTLYADSAIYNYGKLYVIGNLINYAKADGTEASGSRDYPTDKGDSKYDQGYSIKNCNVNSKIFVGGKKLKDSSGNEYYPTIEFVGFIQNYGTVNIMQPVDIGGYTVSGTIYMRVVGENDKSEFFTRRASDSGASYDNAPRWSYINEQSATTNFGSDVQIHTSLLVVDHSDNKDTSVFSCEGNFGYGQAILNGGVFYAKGAVGYADDTYAIHHLEVFYSNTEKKGSYSIVNGYTYQSGSSATGESTRNTNALFYAGGSVQVGTAENASGDNLGGTVQNWGNMYINGSLTVYSNDEFAINKIAVAAEPNSKTFIAGNCWSSGGSVTMRNTMFMCDGNFTSKRCARINCSEWVNSDDDLSSSAYLYVGGDMRTSTLGTSSSGDLAGSISTWNYLDIFSNTNIYVGGKFFTNSIFSARQNVTLIVDNKNNDTGYAFELNDRFENNKTSKEGRVSAMLDTFVVHGNARFNGNMRIPDMTRMYIYGNLDSTNYNLIWTVEVGRNIDVTNDGDTLASKSPFCDNDLPRDNPNFDYNYTNNTYVYVQGDFKTNRKVLLYPGATIKTGGKYETVGNIVLKHDANLYVGDELYTVSYIDAGQYSNVFAKNGIRALNYIVAREHAIMYSGADIKCGTSFEGKTASTIYSAGSIVATTSNIKIRDRATVFCAGNMYAYNYIELGKHDENYTDSLRVAHSSASGVCTCSFRCTGSGDDAHDGDCPVCKSDYSKCTAPVEACICSEKCGDAVNDNCPICSADSSKCSPTSSTSEQCTCTDTQCSSGSVNDSCAICKNDYSKCEVRVAIENDIATDLTDSADGGTFYIGKTLASLSGYIREYGFSEVVVGNYTFARKYITLRSNSDLWVLPEAFQNSTYQRVVKTYESDGTLLGDIITAIKKTMDNVVENFTPHSGSVYALGELTLNKNASLMGTYDCHIFGQTLMMHDSLAYFGHDFRVAATSLQLNIGSPTVAGFYAAGDVYTTIRCTNTTAHPNGYTIYVKDYDSTKNYKCDKCGEPLSSTNVKTSVTCPVTVYANNNLDIITSTNMSMCYLVACNGNVNISDAYTTASHNVDNIRQLPNAIASYNGNVTFNSIYSQINALFYAPKGNILFDGMYQDIWGCAIGNTIKVNTYYAKIHRFPNWRTMDLKMAEVGRVRLISKKEYEDAKNNVNKEYISAENSADETAGGASIFFGKTLVDSIKAANENKQ